MNTKWSIMGDNDDFAEDFGNDYAAPNQVDYKEQKFEDFDNDEPVIDLSGNIRQNPEERDDFVENEEEIDESFNSTLQAENEEEVQQLAGSEDLAVQVYETVKELGLDIFPEDVDMSSLTVEKIAEYKTEYENKKLESVVEYIIGNGKDDKAKAVITAALNGADFDELLAVNNTQSLLDSYKNANPDDVEVQKILLSNYLSEGLDANSPNYAMFMDKIAADIDAMIETFSAKDKTLEAKEFYVKQLEQQAQYELATVAQRQENERKQEEQRKQNAINWNKTFQTSMKELPFSESKKQAILNEYTSRVKVDGNQEMASWLYKNTLIMEDPKLFSYYLDFLNSFDLTTKSFKSSVVDKKAEMAAQQKVSSNIERMIKQKAAKHENKNTAVEQRYNSASENRWRIK